MTQQAHPVQIRWSLQLGRQGRAADREDPLLEQLPGQQPGPFLLAVAQTDVGFAGQQGRQAGGRAQAEFRFRVLLLPGRHPAHQPLAAQGRGGGDAQAGFLRRPQFGAGLVQTQQGIPHHGQVAAAGGGEGDGPVPPLEQALAQVFLQQADAVAHRRRRQVQGFGGGEEAAQAGGRLEGGQGVQGRQVVHGGGEVGIQLAL